MPPQRVAKIKLKIFRHKRRLPRQSAQQFALRRRPLVQRTDGHEIAPSSVLGIHLLPIIHESRTTRRFKAFKRRLGNVLLFFSYFSFLAPREYYSSRPI